MKVALYSTFSDSIADLAAITQPNHEQYAARYGYKVYQDKVDYDESHKRGLTPVRNLLDAGYDLVLLHDCDILFMNHGVRLESIIQSHDSVVMTHETYGWWPINNGVVLFKNGPGARAFCDRITADYEVWKRYELYWQQHAWNLMQTVPMIGQLVRLVSPRVMNAPPVPGSGSGWQLGNFIIHFLGGSTEYKIGEARKYSKQAGEPVYYRTLKDDVL